MTAVLKLKIFVTGNAGAGKTTVARRLAAQSGLPLFHLDQIVWKPGWKKASPEEVAAALDRITRTDGWIIEGVSSKAFEAAEAVIFLDQPRRVCLRRALLRTLRHLLRPRPEVPDDCPEIRILPKLLKIIWQFPSVTRPKILGLIERYGSTKTIHWIRQRDRFGAALADFTLADFALTGLPSANFSRYSSSSLRS